MNKSLMKKGNLFLVFSVVIIFIYLFIKDRYFTPGELKKNGILLTAYTKEWQLSTKAGYGLKYEFFYMGKKNTGWAASKDLKGNLSFENKYFPVLYDPVHGHKELLMEPRIFKEYNIPFPDSLKWVLEFLPK
jgi:hypothetical protein